MTTAGYYLTCPDKTEVYNRDIPDGANNRHFIFQTPNERYLSSSNEVLLTS